MRFLILLLIAGCASAVSEETGRPLTPEEQHPCDPAALWQDFWNCGACSARCPVTDADGCTGGLCSCGGQDICPMWFDCRYGTCVETDLTGSICEFDDECPGGYLCIEGHCTFFNCVPEECDGIDNDCDGVVDGTARGPLSEWCIEGGDVDNILPPCQRGTRICTLGNWSECIGDVPPRDEQGLLACNGLDDDCNGCIDGELVDGRCIAQDPVSFDILFVLDVSGSMRSILNNTIVAAQTFAGDFANSATHNFGIEIIGDLNLNGQAYIFQDLTDFNTFLGALARIPVGGGGSEPQYDAVYEAVSGELPISWHAGSVRIIIVYTDEAGQTYRSLRGLNDITETLMCESLTHGEAVYIFTLPSYIQYFDECSTVYTLGTPEKMTGDMRNSFTDPCGQ